MAGLGENIQRLDAFAKPHEDFRTKTVLGGLVTIISGVVIAALLMFEWSEFQKITWRPELVVDKSRKEQMTIHFDISFPKVPCFALTLDVMDAANDYQNNMSDDIKKVRQNAAGQEIGVYVEPDLKRPDNYCGSCYAAAGDGKDGKKICCNSCSAVFAAYEHRNLDAPQMDTIEQCKSENWSEKIKNNASEGCRMSGRFKVNKVSGNFHFAPGKSYDAYNYHVHDVRFLEGLNLDFTHTIHYLSFGEHHPEIINPLDKVSSSLGGHTATERLFKYYLKIVATDFHHRNGNILHTNQYAVTQNESQVHSSKIAFPSVFFYYDISPMIVIYTEYKRPLTSFLTGICAIVGGVYTIAAILDGIIFQAERRLLQKVAIGKTY